MKYLEEGYLLNGYNNDIYQNNNVKNVNNTNSNTGINPTRNSHPQKLQIEKPFILPVEKPLKSPKRLSSYAVPNRLHKYPLNIQRTTTYQSPSRSNYKQTSKNIFLLGDLVNVYNGFVHKFSNENSSIRAYKTIGHTTLSFASIISMKNRPLLDRRIINESNVRKKKELQERQMKAQEQKKKRNVPIQNRSGPKERNQHLVIDTVHKKYQPQKSVKRQESMRENVDQEIKVEVLRTLSVSESSRLSSESLESLKSIDYERIEDIIDEYLITPSAPRVPTRYKYDYDHLNSLNHLYDAFNSFNDRNLMNYVAWIPLNHKKGYLSASSLLAKKHAPIVFKKTITHPKRVSSLIASMAQRNAAAKSQESSTLNTIKEPSMNPREEPIKKPSSTRQSKSRSNKPSLHSQVAESLKLDNKAPKKGEEQKISNNSKPLDNKKTYPQDSKLEIKLIPQENKVEIKLNPKSKESKSNDEVRPKKSRAEMKSRSQEPKAKEERLNPKPQRNTTELRNKMVKNNSNNNSRKNSTKKGNLSNKKNVGTKIPIFHNSNLDLSSIKIGEYNKNTTIPVQKLNNNISKIPVMGKYEFPFYHMYDAFETYGKALLRAPRAWRQLKRNVLSIASIYAYDNRPKTVRNK